MSDPVQHPAPIPPSEAAGPRPYEPPRVEEHGPLVRLTRQKSVGGVDGFEGSGPILED